MSLRWTGHLPKTADKESFKSNVSSSQKMVDRLRDLMREDLEAATNEASSKVLFSNSNWAEHQAYLMGKQAYIKQIEALLPTYED